MNKIRFILRNGHSFVVMCENVKITTHGNEMDSYNITGIKSGRPLYMSIPDIVAVIDEGPIEESESNENA